MYCVSLRVNHIPRTSVKLTMLVSVRPCRGAAVHAQVAINDKGGAEQRERRRIREASERLAERPTKRTTKRTTPKEQTGRDHNVYRDERTDTLYLSPACFEAISRREHFRDRASKLGLYLHTITSHACLCPGLGASPTVPTFLSQTRRGARTGKGRE